MKDGDHTVSQVREIIPQLDEKAEEALKQFEQSVAHLNTMTHNQPAIEQACGKLHANSCAL